LVGQKRRDGLERLWRCGLLLDQLAPPRDGLVVLAELLG